MPAARRTMVPGMRKVSVECLTCGWKQESSNAQGLAAQHADRNFGHEIMVEILQYLRYIGT